MNHSSKDILSYRFFFRFINHLRFITRTFSPAENILFLMLISVFIISTFSIAGRNNEELLASVAAPGGSMKEGIIGSPRFINPVLAQGEGDKDMVMLVYSGLMKATPEGDLIYDLARSHTVSEDGLSYSFFLKENLTFHDGTPITADDVVFTIKQVKNPALKSPRRASFEGVAVETVSDTEILFTLERPYAPFLENLTLGILPKHMWENADPEEFTFSEFNIEPVGSGPFMVRSIRRNGSGIPEYYELRAFDTYALGKPFIDNMRIYFYQNEDMLIDAYVNGVVHAASGISTKNLAYAKLNKEHVAVVSVPLPRIFGVFFNQNQAPLFSHKEVRSALSVALDKERIVSQVLDGYGITLESPILPSAKEYVGTDVSGDIPVSRRKQAIDILTKSGWSVNETSGVWEKKTKEGTLRLSFSLSTSNAPELKAVADIVKEEWEAIGAEIAVKVFDTGDLNQNVIRPRKYDALLFGEIVGRELDLFAFWHSSQRNDPGLNIALYANITADKLLEDIRTVTNKDERLEKLRAFEEELMTDVPAVFIYAPDFIYIEPEHVSGIRLHTITGPSDRFLNVHEWYIHTDRVWEIFVP